MLRTWIEAGGVLVERQTRSRVLVCSVLVVVCAVLWFYSLVCCRPSSWKVPLGLDDGVI